MTGTTENQTNLPTGERREWVRPVLQRMMAGAAETGDSTNPDFGTEPS